MSTHEQQIFTIFDSKAEIFLPPFYALNDAVAIRRVMATMRDLDHDFCQHAEDYTLFHIGTFHALEGAIDAKPPISLGNLLPMREMALKTKETTHAENPNRAEVHLEQGRETEG